MARISDEDIQRVRDATDVVALISDSVLLKQKGRLFWGCCPFHGEKTASFKIDPGNGLWHCFGCGAGGDAFGYLMKRENLEFPDAVRLLAERARIEIVETGEAGPSRNHKDRIMAAHDEAAEFYHKHLVSSHDEGASNAREYLKKRGFGIDVAKRWQIGWSPGRSQLAQHLKTAGFTAEEIVDANLGLRADDGRIRDRFYERIMFPIHDISGRGVGFGGRVLGAGEPKYLNTGETPVFHKSQNLYAIDIAKNEIIKAKGAVVVEGYTDVIALHEAGIRNVVATLGTALTRKHVKLLGRFTSKVIYLFDADEAGLRAAERAAEFIDVAIAPAGATAIDLRVAVIPEGKDPADYVAAGGADAMLAVLEASVPLMQFVLDRRMARHDVSTPEGRAGALGDAASILATIKGSLLAQDYTNRVADRLLTDYETVSRAISTARPAFLAGDDAPDAAGPQGSLVPLPTSDSPKARAERSLVGLVASYPELREGAWKLLETGLLQDARSVALLGVVLNAGDAPGSDILASLTLHDPEAASLLSAELIGLPDDVSVRVSANELLSKLKEFALERQIIEGKAKMRSLDPVKDRVAYDELFIEISSLTMQVDRVRRGEAGTDDQKVWG
ncbi:MAG: DNA primase [Actinobacteria bacterium]|nr:DNA primase [Actinomycetota bacterium]MCG2807875.1 DNA primase [Coriobacteriia bacterium]